MIRFMFAAAIALSIAASSLALAQPAPRPDAPRSDSQRWQPSEEDIAAFGDARIAALKAGLRLTPEQEKNWPAVEAAIRELAKERADRIAALRAERADNRPAPDMIARIRQRADAMSARAASLRRLADATEPLYRSLDPDQQRRFAVLLRTGPRGQGALGGRRAENTR
jgi:hypothetical protein